ncbi:MAG: hypothetical protein ACLGXA_00845 [Acidobacteriota bacterium]
MCQRSSSSGLSILRAVGTALLVAAAMPVLAQTGPASTDPVAAPSALAPVPQAALAAAAVPEPSDLPASIQPLVHFQSSTIRFSLDDLMDVLRDRRHEGWVLAPYPDPKTGRPLIGAGFSLDLPEREHAQTDPLNPNLFVEPSSAQLWQAAGLDPALLQKVLQQFQSHLATSRTTRRYRRRIRTLAPEISDDQAEALLRISAIQAIVNARAWCRDFDRLSGPQQMAVSQLVYQMGVNLGQFSTFLSLLNNDPSANSATAAAGASGAPATTDVEHWRNVQQSLIHSQWARLYRMRAVSVIAMLDPRYLDSPSASEARVAAVLRPVRHPHRRARAALRTASYHRRSGRSVAKRKTHARVADKA